MLVTLTKYGDSCVSGSMCICVYVRKYIYMSGILTKSIFGDFTYFTYLTTTHSNALYTAVAQQMPDY